MPSSNQTHAVPSGADQVEALKVEEARLQRLNENPPREIFVVSDLHLCRGRNPETGRFSRTED
ncbi:MAG TPA: hypothetical protein VNB54_02090, partial [Alphaproteobacteria bacterium]|nr:hypothetical protein [Alphaproteobacteria bacterium]